MLNLIKTIYFIAFLEGFFVMSIELCSAKVSAPYYGSSFYVWTSILGLTMVFLAIGYYLGGYFSKKYDSSKLLPNLFLISGFFVSLMPIIAGKLIYATLDFPIILGVLMSVFLYLSLPLVVLGMVPPNLINMLAGFQQEPGKSTGTVFMVSTIAGISASLLLGFFILPELGVTKTLYLLALLHFMVVVFLLKKTSSKWSYVLSWALLFFCVLMLLGSTKTKISPYENVRVIYQNDGLLGQVKVMDNTSSQSRTLYVNNSAQTRAHLSGRSLFPYVYYISTFVSHKPPKSKVLLAGMGGGNLVYEMSLFDFDIDVVEIDKRIEEVARKYFLMPLKDISITIDDARHYINQSKNNYDIIVLDMSAGETMPSNVYTLEAFTQLKKNLNEGGFIVLHFLSIYNDNGMFSVKSIGKTFVEAGYQTHLLQTNPSSENPSAFIFVASLTSLDFQNMEFIVDPDLPKELVLQKDNLLLQVSFDDGLVLTDDKPLLDIIHKDVVMSLRRDNINTLVKPLGSAGVPLYK
jgi:predicted membrane-bound spermidine synthase